MRSLSGEIDEIKESLRTEERALHEELQTYKSVNSNNSGNLNKINLISSIFQLDQEISYSCRCAEIQYELIKEILQDIKRLISEIKEGNSVAYIDGEISVQELGERDHSINELYIIGK